MYSKQAQYTVDSFKNKILTHNVCFRYLHKYTAFLQNYSLINYNRLNLNQGQVISTSAHRYVHQRKSTSLQCLDGQHSGVMQIISKRKHLMNYQSSRSFSNIPNELQTRIPITEYAGFFKDLVESPPVLFAQKSLIDFHSAIGLPWWATIILVTCALRTFVTLPFALYQQYVFARLSLIKIEMDDIVKDLKKDANTSVTLFQWPENYTREVYDSRVKEEWNKLVIRDNCHPLKIYMVILLQVPMWLILSTGLRNLTFILPRPSKVGIETYLQLSVDGFGWITNLTVIDPYYILPICFGILNLLNIEILYAMRQHELTKLRRIGFHVSRVVMLTLVPIAGIAPVSMTLYWTASSAYGVLQNLIIYSPRVRRFLRIPNTEFELDHPYRHVFNNIKKKFSLKK